MCKFCDIRRVSRDDGTERWCDADGHVTKWKDENGILHTN